MSKLNIEYNEDQNYYAVIRGNDWTKEVANFPTEEEAQEFINNVPPVYWKGDKAEYTGKTVMLHNSLFYEVKLLEGCMKDQLKVTQKPPTPFYLIGQKS